MTKLEELEKRLTIVESRLNCMEEPATEPKSDPYLVPGVPCETITHTKTVLRYFSFYSHEGSPVFCVDKENVGDKGDFTAQIPESYRVLGTVWDHAPEWAEWVATDESGQTYFYESEPEINGVEWRTNARMSHVCSADPADWKNSLRRRPEWARRKG